MDIDCPSVLEKAQIDSFDYVVALRAGEVIRFREARVFGEWVLLLNAESHTLAGAGEFRFDRGIEVRLEDILWAADAPNGS